ncbi:YtpI family protein [Planococcus beigongshangi]|uniref:YtpI family protein n=1 Tax=Planococcus beigongshangi TaxID=2782536 RepID=UPI00193B01F5|nr:YtpI family protein [Planococcus beigongshangi]
MLIFIFLIVISAVFYFYYKTKQFRATLPIRKKWYAATASLFLGSFILFFGINQLMVFTGIVTYIISGIFIILGLALVIHNYKAARHYHKFVAEETRLNQ